MDIKKALQEEISRLARKELKSLIEPYEEKMKSMSRKIDELRKQLGELEKKKQDKPASYKIPTARELTSLTEEFKFKPESLKRLRTNLKLSQVQLAHVLGVSSQALHGWETGKSTPRRKSMLEIVKIKEIGKRGFNALYKDKLAELENRKQPET